MSNKEKKKNANKALEALKRKKYGHGGLPHKKEKDLYDDSQKSTEETKTGNEYDTDTSGGADTSGGTSGERLTYTGLDGREYSTEAALNAANVRFTNAEDAKNAFTGRGITKEAPTGIVQTAPVATLDKRTVTDINPLTGITKSTEIEKLGGATNATSGTVTAGAMTAGQGTASQATTAVAPSRLTNTNLKY